MAEPATEYSPGEMEVVEQVSTYRAFNGMVKWGSLALAAGLLFLVLITCTAAGLVPAAVITLIVIVAGFVMLRGGKASSH